MATAQQSKWSVADSAHWAAFFRANESRRADAVFRDPFAEKLAGDIGSELGQKLGENPWAWIARTHIIDQTISRLVREGCDAVANLASGLDSRPYRMELPASLRWYEADLPRTVALKNRVLADDKPVCKLERIELDVLQLEARRALFSRIDAEATRTLVVTEGLLIYLQTEQVAELARDLAATKTVRYWLHDIVSPGLLKKMQSRYGRDIHDGAPMQFAPTEGAYFFERYGWRVVEVTSLLKHAAKINRLSLPLRLAAMIPESERKKGAFPWNGVCLLERTGR